jgi:hypothetical protein
VLWNVTLTLVGDVEMKTRKEKRNVPGLVATGGIVVLFVVAFVFAGVEYDSASDVLQEYEYNWDRIVFARSDGHLVVNKTGEGSSFFRMTEIEFMDLVIRMRLLENAKYDKWMLDEVKMPFDEKERVFLIWERLPEVCHKHEVLGSCGNKSPGLCALGY